tara:strand:+ start:557 stop:832 length:276 start_codon:yes stop_codon:yes gene_type:complete
MEEQKELSKEEIKARREEITLFYKENIKHLKIQKEYEELLRDVEKARAERLQSQMFLAQAYAAESEGPQAPDKNEGPEADFEDVKRTLKRD